MLYAEASGTFKPSALRQLSQRMGNTSPPAGPSPWLVLGVALVTGFLAAKVIAWRAG